MATYIYWSYILLKHSDMKQVTKLRPTSVTLALNINAIDIGLLKQRVYKSNLDF